MLGISKKFAPVIPSCSARLASLAITLEVKSFYSGLSWKMEWIKLWWWNNEDVVESFKVLIVTQPFPPLWRNILLPEIIKVVNQRNFISPSRPDDIFLLNLVWYLAPFWAQLAEKFIIELFIIFDLSVLKALVILEYFHIVIGNFSKIEFYFWKNIYDEWLKQKLLKIHDS